MGIPFHNFDFYDVSVILPFYKKLEVFKLTLVTNSKYFLKNGIEVIIVMDECSERDGLLALIEQYPYINWKIICNSELHDWRNPSKVINVGIRNAIYKYILVVGPDSEFVVDVISIFRNYAKYYKSSFFIGKVTFQDKKFKLSEAVNLKYHYYLSYGSLFAERKHLVELQGYNENLTAWGGDDDEIRARLDILPLNKMEIPEVKLLHRDDVAGHDTRTIKADINGLKIRSKVFYPNKRIVNDNHWGHDFSDIIFDYKKNESQYGQLKKLLTEFVEYEIQEEELFNISKKVVALLPVYNEKKHIRSILTHLEGLCDGVIVLDDGSTDDTYELANSKKILLKVKRIRNNHIEELKVRNLLLRMAGFVRSDWFFFIDADERFSATYNEIKKVCDQALSPTICFYLVHLWNEENKYRTDLTEKSPINVPGVLFRWRMFKNIGHCQISFNGNIHVPAIPYQLDTYIAPLLLIHYGMLDAQTRQFKKTRYEIEEGDENACKYDYFLDNNPQLTNIIDLPKLLPLIIYNKEYE